MGVGLVLLVQGRTLQGLKEEFLFLSPGQGDG